MAQKKFFSNNGDWLMIAVADIEDYFQIYNVKTGLPVCTVSFDEEQIDLGKWDNDSRLTLDQLEALIAFAKQVSRFLY